VHGCRTIQSDGTCFNTTQVPPSRFFIVPSLFFCIDTQKQILFDQISDCYVVPPAGNYLFCIPRTLTNVYVAVTVRIEVVPDKSGVLVRHVAFTGLKNPGGFRNLVWAMKRSGSHSNIERDCRDAS